MIRTLGGEGTDRMEALSDGLFAIVLTLLVLQFDVPDVPAEELPAALADQQTLLVSYLLSFLVVGLYWIVHHNVFRSIVGHDRFLLWLNPIVEAGHLNAYASIPRHIVQISA